MAGSGHLTLLVTHPPKLLWNTAVRVLAGTEFDVEVVFNAPMSNLGNIIVVVDPAH